MSFQKLIRLIGSLLVLNIIVFFNGCSSAKKYKVLSFFFDGVPIEDTLTSFDIGDMGINDTIHRDTLVTSSQKEKVYIHEPYLQKECNVCHNPQALGQLVDKQPNLCYQCHDDYSEAYQYTHGPVAGGYCTKCHNPHKSKVKNLIVNINGQICFYCHDEDRLAMTDYHLSFDEGNCTDCHNPHGEANKQLLKPDICKQCHGSFEEQYAFLHGPVAAGYCNLCHGSHLIETEYNLTRTGQNICTECHSLDLVLKNEIHDGIDDFACTECHNPHGGNDRFILN